MMRINTIKAVVLGGVAGTAVLILLDLGLGLMARSLTASPTLFRPVPLFWLVREAVLGTFLGAVTFPSIFLAQTGSNRKAGWLCAVGGGLMALLMLCQIGYVTYQIMYPAPGITVHVPGPTNVPTHIRAIIGLVMFNVPFQWSLLLMTNAVWLLRKRQLTR